MRRSPTPIFTLHSAPLSFVGDELMQSTNQNTDVEIAAIKRDIYNMSELFIRMDNTLGKLTEAANNIGRLLAVQEQRIASSEKVAAAMEQIIERHRRDQEQMERELTSKIEAIQKEVKTDIKSTETEIKNAIKGMRNEMTNRHDDLERRLSVLERWRWIVVGAALAVGFIVAKIDPSFIGLIAR